MDRPVPVLAAALAALASGALPALAGGTIVLDRPKMRAGAELLVTSRAFLSGGPIPAVYSAYDANRTLPVSWTLGPKPTQSYAVMIEDPDAQSAIPIVHWLVWKIPPVATAISETSEPSALSGYRFGETSAGTRAYYGPQPPPGDPPHHYHVEVFALDIVPDVAAGGTVDDLATAMTGHVVAHGELVGTFQKAK